jgi:hypothetical protein
MIILTKQASAPTAGTLFAKELFKIMPSVFVSGKKFNFTRFSCLAKIVVNTVSYLNRGKLLILVLLHNVFEGGCPRKQAIYPFY